MLENLTRESFEPHVGSTVRLTPEGAESLEFTITEVNAVGGTPSNRDPFSVIFKGPAEPFLEQTTHRLEHAELGELVLFLVPVGPAEDGILYEAVFT